jgi:hypothetical protein
MNLCSGTLSEFGPGPSALIRVQFVATVCTNQALNIKPVLVQLRRRVSALLGETVDMSSTWIVFRSGYELEVTVLYV